MEREPHTMEGRGVGVKVEIPGVDVQGTLKPGNLFDTLAALLSMKFDKQITVTTWPPAWMEWAAQKGTGHDAEKVLPWRLPADAENGAGAGCAGVRNSKGPETKWLGQF